MATDWKLRTKTLAVREGDAPLLVGVVNVTPDSFSDGGRFFGSGGFDPERAIEHGLRLAGEGAALLDVGGESTRPGAEPVSAKEELGRVLPVVEGLVRQLDTPISIDTSKASVARAVLEAGVEVVNDVTGLEGDADMLALAADAGAGVCVMHMRGEPRTMQRDPQYTDVATEVAAYLSGRLDALTAAGVAPERICLDPGLGFGKTTAHNLELVHRLDELHALGQPLLVGHSRKRFLGEIIGDMEADRTAATIGAAVALASAGVQLIRVHDVRPVREALLAWRACWGPQT
ncbi:Dihydropteroate synthase [Pseudobythopirellula maris]|uniref:Dihydropteroate synthase n=2 Tax=Pseudobythopirellula maris TaxID=2527991 RepID=A0A5C5ZMT9_9BACT|nr:Dihydropteroate synthase [Pseudobythopirellula maris]